MLQRDDPPRAQGATTQVVMQTNAHFNEKLAEET
jgi:hypothetical protein